MVHAPDDFKVIDNTEEQDLKDLQAQGIRAVMNGHTTYERIETIAVDIGLEVKEDRNNILVVLENDSEETRKSFDRQIYEYKTAVSKNELGNITMSDFDFITFFSGKYVYEEYYLEDLISAFKYTDVDFVTKDNNSEAHNFIKNLDNAYRSLIDITSISSLNDIKNLTNGYNLDGVEIVSLEENAKHQNKDFGQKELSVIVPIHNNGTYLEEK